MPNASYDIGGHHIPPAAKDDPEYQATVDHIQLYVGSEKVAVDLLESIIEGDCPALQYKDKE